MNINSILQTIIYVISSSLMLPVMILLVILGIYILYVSGNFLSEFVERKRKVKSLNIDILLNDIDSKKELSDQYLDKFTFNVKNYVLKLNNIIKNKNGFLDITVENLLQHTELNMISELNRIKMIVRIGPSLGLMGTLIPMGTGLSSLSSGDITRLSSSLIIAFTTTVVGLALGVIAYFYSIIKERWIKEDIMYIEVITEAFMRIVLK
ncbi:MotA/TolQ/ExbB proton channel family protein [Desulfothermus okinawensis JCM 13304]